MDEDTWEKIFTSLKTLGRETKLKEFQYKLIHRIVVTKKEIYRYGIKEDNECIYCGEKDSVTILLEIVISSRFSFNGLSNG